VAWDSGSIPNERHHRPMSSIQGVIPWQPQARCTR
jgi:hypothetical protein